MPCPGWFAKDRGGRKRRIDRSYRPDVSPAHSKSQAVVTALTALDAGEKPERTVLRDAVRALLTELAARAPGRSVEVRVPPYGAIQCVAGPRHTRGNPSNVVETDPITWLQLATGRITWSEALDSGRLSISGIRSDLSPWLPLTEDGQTGDS